MTVRPCIMRLRRTGRAVVIAAVVSLVADAAEAGPITFLTAHVDCATGADGGRGRQQMTAPASGGANEAAELETQRTAALHAPTPSPVASPGFMSFTQRYSGIPL